MGYILVLVRRCCELRMHPHGPTLVLVPRRERAVITFSFLGIMADIQEQVGA